MLGGLGCLWCLYSGSESTTVLSGDLQGFLFPTPDSAPRAPPSMPTPSSLKKPLVLSKRTGLGLSSPTGPVKNYSHAKQLPVAHRPSVFQSPDDNEEEDYEQWLEIKGKLWGRCGWVSSSHLPR